MKKIERFSIIEGLRIQLRPLQYEDLPFTLMWRNNPEIRRWFLNSMTITEEQHLSFFQKYLDNENDIIYGIELLNQTHQIIGQISLYNIDWENLRAEFGRLMIGNESQGKGYAGEATKLLIDYAITELGMKEIFLEVYCDNFRAINIYKKHGFKNTKIDQGICTMVLIT